MRVLNRVLAVTFFASISVLASCASTPTHPFAEPNPLLKEQIEKRVSDLRYMHGKDLVTQLDWIARCGEAAFPRLIEALESGDATTRAGAANVLGRGNDRRVIPFLTKKANDADIRMRFEVARALLRLGDWSHIPTLIAGMRDQSEYVRALCNDALKQSTQIDFGFIASSNLEEREPIVKKWEQWWAARSSDSFYNTNPSSYSKKD